MKLSKVLLLLYLLLNPAASSTGPGPFKISHLRLVNASSTSATQKPEIENNFENGTMEPWVDYSENGTQWLIEKISTAASPIIPPPMESGEHYLWLKQDLETFGIGIISSPKFVAFPGDEIQFSFWIHSSFEYFNNLQVFWSVDGIKKDQKLAELFPASSFSENTEWRQSFVQIPVSKPTEGEIMIYGFCEPKSGAGLIAVDNILLIHQLSISTELVTPTSSSKSVSVTNETDIPRFSEIHPKITTPEMTSITVLTTDVSLSTIFTEHKACPFEPYCLCEQKGDSTYDSYCSNISSKQLRDEYFQKFDENSCEFDIFQMTPPFNDSIPFDVFASAVWYVNWFTIHCDYITDLYEVDPFAFRPIFIANLVFANCNFANLTFLSQFSTVSDLSFINSSNLHDILNTFPEDLQVNILRFESCNLLDITIDDFPFHSKGLTELRIFQNPKVNDDIVNLFFSWAMDFSQDSLVKFYIYNNGLKKIPPEISRFNSLAYFRIDYNFLETGIVKKGELKFSAYTRLVYLRYCGIHTIEVGAFSGSYEMANVYLDGNNLTRFDENVYGSILEQMTLLGDLEDGGFINVEGNKFDCIEDPCHLTWLLRDNRDFLPFIWNAACSNGTHFEDIQPDDPMFKDCQ